MRKWRGLRIGAGGDKAVGGVVGVGGDEERAAEAEMRLGNGASEEVGLDARPARRRRAARALVGRLREGLADFGSPEDAVQVRRLGVAVAVGDGRVRDRAVSPRRANGRAHLPALRRDAVAVLGADAVLADGNDLNVIIHTCIQDLCRSSSY